MFLEKCMFFICSIVAVRAAMEGFIVGGQFADITHFPHSVFLSVMCTLESGVRAAWICGSSIINQRILLTAAHCLYTCNTNTKVIVHFGNENRLRGTAQSAKNFIVHEHYSSVTSSNDIALVGLLANLNLSTSVSRVALMRKPPPSESAEIAGWGLTDEHKMVSSDWLMELTQLIMNRKECLNHLKNIPNGTFCTASRKHSEFVAQGDSGSALVVRGFIQIGIVSFKIPAVAKDIIVYTDVSTFYSWIMVHSERLFCTK